MTEIVKAKLIVQTTLPRIGLILYPKHAPCSSESCVNGVRWECLNVAARDK